MKHISTLMTRKEIENASIDSDDHLISTGYEDLDRLLGGGFRKGDLTIIAGREGNAAIPLISNLVLNISNNNTNVLFNSFWRNFNDFLDASLTSLTGIPVEKYYLNNIKLNEEQELLILKGKEAIKTRDAYVIDDSANELGSLLLNLRKHVYKYGIKIILIDSIDVIYTLNTFHIEEEKQIVAKSLKSLAIELDVPIVILAKITKQHNNPRQMEQMSTTDDLNGVDAYANQVIFCNRPEIYGLQEDEDGVSTNGMLKLNVVSSGKGNVGTINLKYEESIDRISDFSSK